MTEIASVDYDNKRIYLHSDTVINGFDPMAGYFEINVLRQLNASGEQNRNHMMSAEGYIAKGGGKFTPRYVLLESGWRYVPNGGVKHTLAVSVEPVSKDGISGRDVFDRSTLSVAVDVDTIYEQVEVVTVATGSGLDAGQDAKLTAINAWIDLMYKAMDLDAAKPNTYADDGSEVVNPDFTRTKTDNGNSTFTVQRS